MQNHDSATTTYTSFAPFVHLVKEITMEAPRGIGLHWQRDALVTLQLATEDFLVMVFEMMYVPVVYVC